MGWIAIRKLPVSTRMSYTIEKYKQTQTQNTRPIQIDLHDSEPHVLIPLPIIHQWITLGINTFFILLEYLLEVEEPLTFLFLQGTQQKYMKYGKYMKWTITRMKFSFDC